MVKKTFYRQKNWHSIPLKFCFCPPDLIRAFTLLSARLTPEERICLFSFTVFVVYWVSVEVAALSNLSGFVCLPCFSWRTKTGSRKRLKCAPELLQRFGVNTQLAEVVVSFWHCASLIPTEDWRNINVIKGRREKRNIKSTFWDVSLSTISPNVLPLLKQSCRL